MQPAPASTELGAKTAEPLEASPVAKRSDAQGLARLLGHLLAMLATGAVYHWVLAQGAPLPLAALAAIPLGFTLVTFFAAMHESVHRTAFATRWLNDAVAWLSGLLSFYNSTFYRPYHGWHHRFTQLPGQDPELEDAKPTELNGYLLELSGLSWWLGKLRTYARLGLGLTRRYAFLTEQVAPLAVRSVRAQLLVYAIAIALSAISGYPYFFVYWLIPLALGQPLLRAILLAEHTGCTNDENPLTNTRTTYTLGVVRFLMWEMPYHAEHHRYPAVPFFALAKVHERLGSSLSHVARDGYLGFHQELLATFSKEPSVD